MRGMFFFQKDNHGQSPFQITYEFYASTTSKFIDIGSEDPILDRSQLQYAFSSETQHYFKSDDTLLEEV